ncbi:hypothetical protein P5673_027758, partial [Acropora cervicornis]
QTAGDQEYYVGLTAASVWGYPSSVRADNGGENIAVGEFMVWFPRETRGSFLTGPNHLFLDTGDDRDVYSLHYIFLPRIPRLLD